MATSRMGRPSKVHKTAWGEEVPGLYKMTAKDRWLVKTTGQTFTESDERVAVARFKALNPTAAETTLSVGKLPENLTDRETGLDAAFQYIKSAHEKYPNARLVRDGNNVMCMGFKIPESLLWDYFREQFINDPIAVSRKVGIPELANWKSMPLPKASLKLDELLETYKKHNQSTDEAKKLAAKTFDDFKAITKARTLDDLTTEVLKDYRESIKQRVKSPGTIAAYFGRVKNIIRFGKTEGLDAVQIDAALSRLAVLKNPKDTRVHNPSPITKDAFHKLYKTAGELYPEWQARLLLTLNICTHFDETLDVQWHELDLEKGTFVTHRNKTGRVIRAATLWPETIKHLESIKKTQSPFVFVSKQGTRFNSKGQWKTWEKIRTKAGCTTVKLDDIRDGAYTAACNAPGVDEKYARLLAGHRSHGLQDSYVQRNPKDVKPACDAVYAAFGPFPIKEPTKSNP